MKKILLLFLIVVVFISCKKDYSCEDCVIQSPKTDTVNLRWFATYYAIGLDIYNYTFNTDVEIDKPIPVPMEVIVKFTSTDTTIFVSTIIPPNILSGNTMIESHSGKDYYVKELVSVTPNQGNGWILKY